MANKFTFLLCSNASGDRMLKSLLVNRSLKPRALKGKDTKKLPVHLMTNKKAWVTTFIFTEWFNKCFVAEVAQYIKFTFQYIFVKLESKTTTITDVWKKFNILDCMNHAALAIAEIRPQTLNAGWRAVWPECVLKKNESNQITTIPSEIISLAKGIGEEGFDTLGEDDIEEPLVYQVLSERDVLKILESPELGAIEHPAEDSEQEKETVLLNANLIREGLQLATKLEDSFLINDDNSERALKFQREHKLCMSGYRDLYKELFKPSQCLITEYFQVKEKQSIEVLEDPLARKSDDVIVTDSSSSDESDFIATRKRIRTLSYSEE